MSEAVAIHDVLVTALEVALSVAVLVAGFVLVKRAAESL